MSLSENDVQVFVSTGLEAEDPLLWDSTSWNESNWNSDDIAWQDITSYCLSFSCRGGQPSYDARFQAGTGRLLVSNLSGVFNPLSGVSIWNLPFRPGRFVQVRRKSNGTPIFTGRIGDISDAFSSGGSNIQTEIPLVDALGDLAAINLPALETPTGVQSTSDRIEAVLDRAEVPEEVRFIQTGEHEMPTSFLAQSLLEEAMRASDAEGGAFFADAANNFHFKARDWLTTDERSTVVQGYLGYEGTGASVGIEDMDATLFALSTIRNDVIFSRNGGEQQRVFDEVSIGQYGRRTAQRLDLFCNTDEEVLFLAERTLAATKDLRVRIQSVTLDSSTANDLHFSLTYGDLVSVRVVTDPGWQFTTPAHIIGIEREIGAGKFRTKYHLDQSLAE